MKKQHIVYLHLGSNLNDRNYNIKNAIKIISEQIGKIYAVSGCYETEAWGNRNQNKFFNRALKIETHLSPILLLNSIQKIENDMGRKRNGKWTPRIIDIDILFYDDEIVNTQNLIIPHPLLHKRNFVLIPMLEIAPDIVHPVLNKSITKLYVESKDFLQIKLLEKY